MTLPESTVAVQAHKYKISIIMPTHNRAAYIVETIESVRQQTYSNWELIIVDDGSDDNTEELVAAIGDDRIQFHKAGRIQVVAKIKNTGLKVASGELVAFIDSDDLWEPTKLEKQVTALQQYPEAGFALTGGYNFKVPGQAVEYFYEQTEGLKYGSVFGSFFESKLPGFSQALMVRKECFATTGFFKEAISFSDVDFIVNLAFHFKAITLYEPLFFRRLHTTNLVNSSWKTCYQEGIDIIQFYKYRKLVDSGTADKALFNTYMNFGENCLLHGERVWAITNFLRAWKNKPFSIIPFRKMAKAILLYFKY